MVLVILSPPYTDLIIMSTTPTPSDIFDSFRKKAISSESTEDDIMNAIIALLLELELDGKKRTLSQTEKSRLLIDIGRMYEFTKNKRYTFPDNLEILLTNWGLLKD